MQRHLRIGPMRGTGRRPARGTGHAGRRLGVCGLALALAAAPLAGCGAQLADDAQTAATTSQAVTASTLTQTSATAVSLIDASTLFSDRDLDPSYDASTATTVSLADTGSTASGSGVTVEGSTVTIRAEGTYVLSGTLSDGRIVVDAADDAKVQLVLNGAQVTSSTGTALYVRGADKVFVTLADGTYNVLAATGADTAEDERTLDGALYSADDLTVNGAGALAVSSAQGHGIVVKDDLTLVSGEVSVEAARHAVQAKDSVSVAGGTWTLTGGTDAVHCSNDEDATLGSVYVGGGTLELTAGSDGIDAGNQLQVDGGTLSVSAGDDGLHAERDVAINGGVVSVTQSYEALEGSTVSITGGTLSLVASDDGINAAGDPTGTVAEGADNASDADAGAHWGVMAQGGGAMAGGAMDENDETARVLISGSVTTIDAGGDGIDSNGDLTITGGETYVSGPVSGGDGALDYAGTGSVSGGILVAAGSTGMAQNLGSESTQGTMLVGVSGNAGDTVTLTDASGTVLASYAPTKAYGCVVVSAPGVASGGTYTLSAGSSSVEVTMDGTTYSDVAGSGGGMGGPGGMGAGAGGGRSGDAAAMGGRGGAALGGAAQG